MVISESTLSWLSSNLKGSIDAGDLAASYSFEHGCNRARELVSLQAKVSSVAWRIDLLDGSGAKSLEQPLSRSIHSNLSLWGSTSNGTVVYNHAFYPIRACQRSGLARALYANEERLYAKWGVREIQMMANDDGPEVWVRNFGFLPKDPHALRETYRAWARRWRPSGIAGQHQPAAEPPELVKDYPDAFLRTRAGLMLYKMVLA